jgi:microcystin-dependent protein
MSRRLEIKNLDSAHDVGPTGSASAQIFVQDGKLMAQLQGQGAVELADLGLESTGSPTGTIATYASSTIPAGWLECDGSDKSKTTYAELFTLITTDFGTAVDATNDFKLPDLRGRAVLGAGTGSGLTARSLGVPGGVEDVTLSGTQIPNHSHSVSDSGHSHGTTDSGHSHSDSGHVHGWGGWAGGGQHSHGYSQTTVSTNTGGFDDDGWSSAITSVNVSSSSTTTSSETIGGNTTSGSASVSSATSGVAINSATTGISVTGGGGTDPVSTMTPFLALTCIIKT